MEKTLNDFIAYLKDQLGEPYLWGGQHTKLTPETYVSIIEKKEDGRGGYRNMTYAQAAIDFCKRKFDAGAKVLYAYDCSGLGCYWLYNLAHLYKGDVNANTMMSRCLLQNEPPRKGWWVFRLDGKRASHIGYMIDDQYLIEAKGRKYGVVKTKFRKKDWDKWGIPQVFAQELTSEPTPKPAPAPEPVPAPQQQVEVLGGSVWVRAGDSTKTKKLFVAHRGDRFPLLGVAPSGWYRVSLDTGNLAQEASASKSTPKEGYISNKPKYTRLV